jgi:hypothetical protein
LWRRASIDLPTNAIVRNPFSFVMTSKQPSKHGSRQRNRLDVAELYLKGGSSLAMVEFYGLLEDSESAYLASTSASLSLRVA